MIRNWKNERRYAIERHPKCHQVLCVCEYDALGHIKVHIQRDNTCTAQLSIQMTQEIREGEAGAEDKKRYDRIQHAPYSLDPVPFDFAFFPPTEIKSTWKEV